MNRRNRLALSAALSLVLFAAVPLSAYVRLPNVIGSNMVLQQNIPIPVWGWAECGEHITVEFAGSKVGTRADAKGRWMVKLPARKAGGPWNMTIQGDNKIRLTNILAGEVWICSGQSNMAMGIGLVIDSRNEISSANYPGIRLLKLPKQTATGPVDDVDAQWLVCSPETVSMGDWGGFSAVGYLFGRRIHKTLGVPVGIIDSSWGGTRIESWTPPAGFAQVPKLHDILAKINDTNAAYKKTVTAAVRPLKQWIAEAEKALSQDNPVPLPPRDADGLLRRVRNPKQPAVLYNGMVHPLVPFAIRGAIWYQGESNCGDGMMYYEKMKALIGGWRQVWGQGDFPFYYVQLAPCSYYRTSPTALPEIWEAQTAALSIPNTGMAVTYDTVDDMDDIHPKNKQQVGRRLALWALARTYGYSDIIYSGPLYKSISIEGNKVRIRFSHVGSGLTSYDGGLLGDFEIAAADRKFVKAKAEIAGDSVVVSSEAVTAPVAIRYGWHQTAQPNLINKEGLPASPFRTDNW